MDEKSLDKLGTVLAVTNKINRDMLDVINRQQEMLEGQQAELRGNYTEMRRLLDRQQRRQAWIVITSVIAVAAVVLCSYLSFNRLADRIDSGVEVLRHESTAAGSARLP